MQQRAEKQIDPQAGAVSRIRRRILVRRKSAEKSLARRIHISGPAFTCRRLRPLCHAS